jgi:hypothetical protein
MDSIDLSDRIIFNNDYNITDQPDESFVLSDMLFRRYRHKNCTI